MALTDKLSAIGNAIRAKTGKTELLTLAQMPAEIESIETGGSMPDFEKVVVSGSDFEEWLLTARYIDDDGLMHQDKVDYYNDWLTEVRSGYCFSSFYARSITLPNLETHYSLRNGFFAYNPVIEEVYVPKLQKLAMDCFNGCTKLNRVDVSSVQEISTGGFKNCYKLVSIDLPVCKKIDSNAFESSGIITINAPLVETVGDTVFRWCNSLESIKLPALKQLGNGLFEGCGKLKLADFNSVNTINGYSWNGPFAQCSNLETLILRSNSVVSTSSDMSGLLSTTKIKSGGTGYIYVPSALIEDYKVATNWATVASQFRAIEDYPDICG